MTTICPFAFYALRPDTLPDLTRHVEVDGHVLPVSITATGGGYLALHTPTGEYGYALTEDDAVAECGEALAHAKAFYLDGPCAGMEMPGNLQKKRAALRETFTKGY